MDAAEARALFERELDAVESALRWVCRERCLDGDEAESFRSHARFRIMDDDYAVIRKFSGRSSLRTFLVTVVSNAYLDYRIARWGKWRPSAAAVRMGRAARLLDTYLNRDGHPLEEAIERVLSRDDVSESEAELRGMARELPRRTRRSFTSLDDVPPVAAPESADEGVLAGERERLLTAAHTALERAMATLPPQDRTIVRLHVAQGMTLASVARTMRLEQKPLYRRFHRALARLREALLADGVDRGILREILPL